MKKLVLIMVLAMSVLIVTGQVDTTKKEMKPKATTVKVAELPKTITDNIARDYPGFTVKEASSATMDNALHYQVVIAKGTETETLMFDKDGKLLNKLPKKTGSDYTPK